MTRAERRSRPRKDGPPFRVGDYVRVKPGNLNAWPLIARIREVLRGAEGGWWFRGFLGRVDCPADWWLRHADAIYWHPEQTVPCGICGGDGLCRENKEWGCHDCGGSGHMPGRGRFPRPCPPTAHPLEQVTLTTLPRVDVRGHIEYAVEGVPGWHDCRDLCARLGVAPDMALRTDQIVVAVFAARWEGVTFTAPPGGAGDWLDMIRRATP